MAPVLKATTCISGPNVLAIVICVMWCFAGRANNCGLRKHCNIVIMASGHLL